MRCRATIYFFYPISFNFSNHISIQIIKHPTARWKVHLFCFSLANKSKSIIFYNAIEISKIHQIFRNILIDGFLIDIYFITYTTRVVLKICIIIFLYNFPYFFALVYNLDAFIHLFIFQ